LLGMIDQRLQGMFDKRFHAIRPWPRSRARRLS
jgi:hypothetical protein